MYTRNKTLCQQNKQGANMKEFDELDISLRETKAHKLMQRADLRERVVRAMRQNPDMTMTQIQKRFGISHSLLKALLSEANYSEAS